MTRASTFLPAHVAVSGELGSGKSVVSRMLGQVFHAKVISTGDVQRSIARSLGLSTLETNLLAEQQEDIDSRVDSVTRELGSHAPYVIFDSRMAWVMVPSAFKVHLLVDPLVAAQRIHLRGASAVESYASEHEALRDAENRYQSERRRFTAKYGVDISRLRNYDLVVDTTGVDVDTVVALISIEAVNASQQRPVIWVRRSRIRNLAPDEPQVSAGLWPSPSVIYCRPEFAAVTWRTSDSHSSEYDDLVQVRLVAEGMESYMGSPVPEILKQPRI